MINVPLQFWICDRVRFYTHALHITLTMNVNNIGTIKCSLCTKVIIDIIDFMLRANSEADENSYSRNNKSKCLAHNLLYCLLFMVAHLSIFLQSFFLFLPPIGPRE